MILKQITSPNLEESKTEKEVEKSVETSPSDAKKRTEERSSFMIDDILGRKSIPPPSPDISENSNKLKDGCLVVSVPELQDNFPDQNNESVVNSSLSIPNLRQPVKPTPMLLSPLCSGFLRFGLFSPTICPDNGHSLFPFTTGDSAVQVNSRLMRNEQLLRSAVFPPSNFFEFASNGIKPLEVSQSSMVGMPSSHSECPRPLIWKDILHRNTPKRKGGQIRFTSEQTSKLEKTFTEQKYLSPTERKRLASLLRLTERQVKTWFQNRRAKWRRLKQEHSSHVMNNAPDQSLVMNQSIRPLNFSNADKKTLSSP